MARLLSKEQLADGIYSMWIEAETVAKEARPGQFVSVYCKDGSRVLPRPISICEITETSLRLVYRVAGAGTAEFSAYEVGEEIRIQGPFGNGFPLLPEKAILIGGGIGVPPMYGLAKDFINRGIIPQVIVGFNSADDVILLHQFKRLGIEPIVTTVDGSIGIKGFVTDAMKELDYDYVYTCGPEPMLKAIWDVAPDGQFSFEARMACGFGACMGCTCETKYGYKRICKDGPVLYKEEIIW